VNLTLLHCIAIAWLTGQGLFFVIAPHRAAAFQLWQYRLFGARPAEPGSGTILFYRISGIACLAMAAFILIQFVSE
jgi:hypothetical protein